MHPSGGSRRSTGQLGGNPGPLVDAFATMPHYWRHIAPVWEQLRGLGLAGNAYGPRAGCGWGEPANRRRGPHTATRPVIVASIADYRAVAPAPVIYLEHGAGQHYPGDPQTFELGGYSGARGLDRAVLFLCPSEAVGDRWRALYDVPAIAVGCPRLDRWHATRSVQTSRSDQRADRPVVAITFHWECTRIPETRGAWSHYDPALSRLVREAPDRGWQLLGHGHPRLYGRLERRWRQLRVDRTPDIDVVLERADVLVADNTSAMFEFASLGKPVVVLDAPWYRRDVDHGGRFWTWADIGVRISEPDELQPAIAAALTDPPDVAANRRRIIREVYAPTDGQAAARAAAAIREVLCGDPG